MTNDAFLLKLAWGILTNGEALWVQVIKSKYFRNWDSSKQIMVKPSDSYLWKNIQPLWPFLL